MTGGANQCYKTESKHCGLLPLKFNGIFVAIYFVFLSTNGLCMWGNAIFKRSDGNLILYQFTPCITSGGLVKSCIKLHANRRDFLSKLKVGYGSHFLLSTNKWNVLVVTIDEEVEVFFFERCSVPFAKKKFVAKMTCSYIVWSVRRLMQVFTVDVQSSRKLYSLCVKSSMFELWKHYETCSPLGIRRLKTNAFLNINLFVVNRAW